MKINDKIIDRIAFLSRLEFKDKARKNIKNDLNKMLSFVEQLNELDTANVEPLIYMCDEVNILREDEVHHEISQYEALKNAPEKISYYFKVHRVIDKS